MKTISFKCGNGIDMLRRVGFDTLSLTKRMGFDKKSSLAPSYHRSIRNSTGLYCSLCVPSLSPP